MKESILFEEGNKDLTKYFLHGFILSLGWFGLPSIWEWLYTFTDPIIIFTGSIIAYVIFTIIIGILNSWIALRLWEINTRGYWLHQLGHGLILSILLGVFGLVEYIVLYFLIASYVFFFFLYIAVSFFVSLIIGGYIGIRVAEIFQIKPSDIDQMRVKSIKGLCPYCNTSYFYTESSIGKEGHVICMNCSKRFQIRGKDDSSFLEVD